VTSTRLTSTLAWWLSAAALPVVAVQGKRLRKTVPRLPEAAGADRGVVAGSSQPLAITVIGESTVAGVGVADHSQGIACRLAEQLRENSGRETAWQKEIARLIEAIRARGAQRIEFTAVPPLHIFPALPQPMKTVLGTRSRLRDWFLRDAVSSAANVDYLAVAFPTQPD
jgi:hypothetical protein